MSKRDTIIGAVSGLSAKEVTPWAASARHVHDGDIVLLTDTPEVYNNLGAKFGVEVRTAAVWRDRNDKVSIFKDRWEELRGWLHRKTEKDAQVLTTDVRDVVFQRDPFKQLLSGSHLSVASEGRPIWRCSWSREQMQKYFPRRMKDMREHAVLCAGVVGGPGWLLEEFAAKVYRTLTGLPGMADQSAFNIIAREYEEESNLSIRNYAREAWACHLVQMYPGSIHFVPGERSEQFVTRAMTDTGPEACNGEGIPFAVVHHWTYAKKDFGAFADIDGAERYYAPGGQMGLAL